MGKLLEQRNRALDDINAGRTVRKIRDLESRVRELEEENARLKAECDDIKQVQFPRKLEAVAVNWKKQLAAEQLNNKRLRKALEAVIKVHGYESGIPVEALSIPASTEALDKYVAEEVNEIESCRDWYKRRIDLLQEWQSKMRDPERTIVCDIIANGLTMPEGGRYEIGKSDLSTITRQRDLAVEALKSCGVNDGLNGPTQYFDEDLVKLSIKESEVK